MARVWQQAADESIVAFASVRNQASTSHPSSGDWLSKEQQTQLKTTYGDDIVPAMIEVTRGSPNKYEIDKDTGQLMLDRVLHSAVYYPGDYGYIPQTLCGDGDPVDILIVAPAESGTVHGLDEGVMTNCRVVGVMDMEDEAGKDEKLIAVLANRHSTNHIDDITKVPEHLRKEIQHFFENYKVLELKKGKPKWAKVLGWGDKEKALEVVATSRAMYVEANKDKEWKMHPFVKVAKCPSLLHVKQNFGSDTLGPVSVYVNVSKGSMNSYVYRQDTSYRHYKYTLDMPYPGDYGWISQTWQPALRKPIEVLVLSTFPICAECLVDVRVIGAFERSFRRPRSDSGIRSRIAEASQSDDNFDPAQTDIKVFAVVNSDPRMNHIRTLSDLNEQAVQHFIEFFNHSGRMAGGIDLQISMRMEVHETEKLILKAHDAYSQAFGDTRIHNAPNLWCLPWGTDATQGDAAKRVYPAIVEAAKHSSNRYTFDENYGVLRCFAPLATSTFWPGNVGFIPQTVAEDGKPVDVIILSTVPLRNSAVAEIRIVGAAECIDEMGPDLKMIGVPNKEPRMKEWDEIDQVPKHILDEMVHFFNAYKDLDKAWKFCRFERWMNANQAMSYLQSAHSRFFLFVLPMRRLEKRMCDLEEENMKLKKAKSTS